MTTDFALYENGMTVLYSRRYERVVAGAIDHYWDEPDAMTRERELWAHSLIRWCRY